MLIHQPQTLLLVHCLYAWLSSILQSKPYCNKQSDGVHVCVIFRGSFHASNLQNLITHSKCNCNDSRTHRSTTPFSTGIEYTLGQAPTVSMPTTWVGDTIAAIGTNPRTTGMACYGDHKHDNAELKFFTKLVTMHVKLADSWNSKDMAHQLLPLHLLHLCLSQLDGCLALDHTLLGVPELPLQGLAGVSNAFQTLQGASLPVQLCTARAQEERRQSCGLSAGAVLECEQPQGRTCKVFHVSCCSIKGLSCFSITQVVLFWLGPAGRVFQTLDQKQTATS